MNANLIADFMNGLGGLWADWALAASWQIALLVVLVAGVALASRHLSARFRYLLWMLVLIKALMPPTLGASWAVGNWAGPGQWEASRAKVAGVLDATVRPELANPPVDQPVASAPVARAVQTDDPADGLANDPAEAPVGESAPPITQGDVAPTPDAQPAAPAVLRPAWSLNALALAAWLTGFGLFTLFIAVRYLRLTRMLRSAAEVDEGPLRVVLEHLSMRLGRSNPPALLLSDAVSSPFLVGLLRPRIVLPAGLPGALEPGQIEDVLLHELTHWRRRDLAVTWVQILVQGLFWFHPLVWLAGAQLRHERECACDEAALASGCAPARRYGESLLKVLLAARGRSAVAMGFLGIFERNTRLQRRLEEIMNQENKVRRLGVGGWLALVLFAALCLPMAAVETDSIHKQDSTSKKEIAETSSAVTEARVYRTGPQWERPFVNDSDVLGHWTAVDFVKDISQFVPGKKQWQGDLFLKELDFLPGGKTKHAWQSWTHGWLWHAGDKAEGKYEIRMIDGRPYLFMEWISGDVILRGMKPQYYVFAKDVKGADPIVGRWRGAGSGDGSVMTFEPDQRWWSADDGGSSDQGRWYSEDGKYRFEDSKGQVLPFDVLVESDRLTLVSVTEPDEKFEMVREKTASKAPSVDERKTSCGQWFLAGNQPQSYDLICGADDPQGAIGCALQSNKPEVKGFGTVMAEMPAESYRGKRVRLSAVVETRDVPIRAAMWMRVDGADGKALAFDNMGERPIKGTVAGQACDIVLDVPQAGEKIAYGLLLAGTGYARIGNVKFEAVGAEVPVTSIRDESSATSGPPPRVVSTSPAVGAIGVDPATTEITVTFDRDMSDGMSWTGGGPDFPPVPEGARPAWRDKRTCVRPVKLEAAKYYRIGINSTSYQNFMSADGVPARPISVYFATKGAPPEVEARVIKPRIVTMEPANGATDVDPSIKELRVTFSVPMGGGFSWTGGGPNYPKGREGERPHWSADGLTCTMPVTLEPGKNYRLGLNSPSHKNFASRGGVPLDPVTYMFQTRQ